MTCEIEKIDDRVHIRGEMTIYAAANLKDKLFGALEGESDFCLDLSAVSEVDTTGVQLLLLTLQTSIARGMKFSLVRPSDAVSEALALLRLEIPIQTASSEATR